MTPLQMRIFFQPKRTPQNQGREGKKDDVHGQDVEQGWAIEQQDGAGNGDERVSEIEVEQIADRGFVSSDGKCRCHGEGQRQHDEVIAVDFERALPQANANSRGVLSELAH